MSNGTQIFSNSSLAFKAKTTLSAGLLLWAMKHLQDEYDSFPHPRMFTPYCHSCLVEQNTILKAKKLQRNFVSVPRNELRQCQAPPFVNKEDPKCHAIKITERDKISDFALHLKFGPEQKTCRGETWSLAFPPGRNFSHRKKLFRFLRHPGNKVEKQKASCEGKEKFREIVKTVLTQHKLLDL